MPLVPVAEPRFSCRTVLPIRFRVLTAFAAVSFLQGASFSVFALNPDLSILLLPSLTRNLESWTLNCNSIAQAGFIFIAIYLLRERPSPALSDTACTIVLLVRRDTSAIGGSTSMVGAVR